MEEKGILFEKDFQEQLKSKFYFPDRDPVFGERLFFDNSGGSLRLKAAVDAKAELEQYPDCPERYHERALILKKIVSDGTKEILELIFNAKPGQGALMTELTASQTMFQMVSLIMENAKGTNAVVSSLEHPSAFDSIEFYCNKTGKEMRVIEADKTTGRINPEKVAELVDENTCLLSVMSASNISGSVMDMEGIVKAARQKNPDIYIISDAVQHAPHMKMDVDGLKIDGMNFAPYKFFGVRGCGFAYISDRVAKLPHHKLIKKDEKVFELGTPAPGNFAAMMAVIDYVAEIGAHFINSDDRKELYDEGMRRIHLQERALLYRLLEGTEEIPGLRYIKGVKVMVDQEDLTGRDLIAGIEVEGINLGECVKEYQRRGVTVCERAADSIYSKRIVNSLGSEKGLIRVSPMHCHGIDDIDKFLKITKELVESIN